MIVDAAEGAEASALWHLCRQLTETAPLPMAAVEGPQHRVRSVNPAFCRLIQVAREAVIGRPFAEVVPEWAGSQALLDRVSRTGEAAALIDQAQVHAASSLWSCTVWPVPGQGGQPVGLMILVPETPDAEQFRHQLTAMNQALVVSSVHQHALTDAAETLTAQATAQKVLLETILEQAAEEIVVRDAQGRLLLANAEVRRWVRPAPDGPAALEGTPLEAVPHLWGDILDADGKPIPPEDYPIARALRGEGVPPLEFYRVAPDGRTRVLLNTAALLRDTRDTILGAVAISTEITQQKEKEAELRQAHAELERRVQERTAELSQAIQQLERQSIQLRALASELTLAEERERQRVAEVLHTDLQQLLVGTKLLLSPLAQATDPNVREVGREVGDLITRCLQCSRSLTEELSPPILHRGGLVPALEWLVQWMAEKHHLRVVVHADATPGVDSHDITVLLFQAVRELLLNAVKHAHVQIAQVEVTRRDDHVRVSVSDAGVGFDPASLRVAGGTAGGFGLFSLRERLELLGGRLEIDSAPGTGSRFTLWLPLQPAGPSTTAPSGRGGRKIRVLVVDDHRVMRQGLVRLLAEAPDIEVVGEAADGETAVALTRELLPDVVTMDVDLPGMDGLEATRRIHAECPAIRVIGLSMYETQVPPMREAGAVAFLPKSGPVETLVAAIRASGPPT